jgi:hypothetical protein
MQRLYKEHIKQTLNKDTFFQVDKETTFCYTFGVEF